MIRRDAGFTPAALRALTPQTSDGAASSVINTSTFGFRDLKEEAPKDAGNIWRVEAGRKLAKPMLAGSDGITTNEQFLKVLDTLMPENVISQSHSIKQLLSEPVCQK